MALELLAALDAAHERGIIHRDIKPANVFFDAAGNAKLGDFGAAHLVDFGQTQTGGLVGTIAYMAPEQITGASIGAAADLYALGVTLFEALTGRPPFLGPRHRRAAPGRRRRRRRARCARACRRRTTRCWRACWPRRPAIGSRSAQEMAAVVRAWPTEPLPAGGSRATRRRAPSRSPPRRRRGDSDGRRARSQRRRPPVPAARPARRALDLGRGTGRAARRAGAGAAARARCRRRAAPAARAAALRRSPLGDLRGDRRTDGHAG